MGAAFGWGLLAASSLVIGAIAALVLRIDRQLIGLIMGFGAGVLISALSFDLVEEAVDKGPDKWVPLFGILAGCLVFFGGDLLISRSGGADRKDSSGAQEDGSPLAIVLGTVLDGIPESLVIGLTIVEGGAVGTAYLAAVFISNLPEAISSTAGLVASGWRRSGSSGCGSRSRSSRGSSSLLGYSLFRDASPDTVAFILTFAAGGILAMLAETMMPEAFEQGHKLVGIATTLGFVVAFGIHQLD